MKGPPNVAGKWSVVEYKVINGINNIYNPEKITYTTSFEQNGRFVQFLSEYANFYGVWKYNCKGEWELYVISNDSDNDTFLYTPLCVKKGKVYKMDGINWEAGTIPENKQNAQVSWSEWVRINWVDFDRYFG